MTPAQKILWNAAFTGKYPQGTTSQDLAATTTDNTGWSALHIASIKGQYPPGTTTQQLANTKTTVGWSALHTAAENGHLPPGTTSRDLAETIDKQGRSALHCAATNNHLPTDTTAKQLAQVADINRWSALHNAAMSHYLPADTTTLLLKSTINRMGTRAWDALCSGLDQQPANIIQLAPHLFCADHPIAIAAVTTAIQCDPSLKAKATLWLGKVFATQSSQTHQAAPTTPTCSL